jgi:hypothetical protein
MRGPFRIEKSEKVAIAYFRLVLFPLKLPTFSFQTLALATVSIDFLPYIISSYLDVAKDKRQEFGMKDTAMKMVVDKVTCRGIVRAMMVDSVGRLKWDN